MGMINFYAAWIGVFLGCVCGAIQGLFFHKDDWLGGYASWQRRMFRLGHISFFGIGFINLSFALTVAALGIEDGVLISSRLLIIAMVTMPLLCFLSAVRKNFRHLFFIPAGAVIAATALFIWRLFLT